MNLIKNLGDYSTSCKAISGGKAYALSLMVQAGLPIPKGCVIGVDILRKHLLDNKLVEKTQNYLLSTLSSSDPFRFEAEKIKECISSSNLDKRLHSVIDNFCTKNSFISFAIRSSTVGEDSKDNSWAGCFDSYLNVNKDTLSSRLLDCWSSLYGIRAIQYARIRRLPLTTFSMAVIVQEMINSDVAGVCFTANPVTGDMNNIVIEACRGLGDKLVAGEVIPSRFIYSRKDLCFVESTNIKNTFYYGMDCSDKNILTENEVIGLVELALIIEKLFGAPQDIEWAIQNGKIYILQSRPITRKF